MPGVVLKTLTKRYGDLAAVEGLPELRALAPHDRRAERGVWPALQARRIPERSRPSSGGDAARRPAGGIRAAISRRALGRAAAAGRGGARARGGAGDPTARRASEQPG